MLSFFCGLGFIASRASGWATVEGAVGAAAAMLGSEERDSGFIAAPMRGASGLESDVSARGTPNQRPDDRGEEARVAHVH